jgi:hypothetical protein
LRIVSALRQYPRQRQLNPCARRPSDQGRWRLFDQERWIFANLRLNAVGRWNRR